MSLEHTVFCSCLVLIVVLVPTPNLTRESGSQSLLLSPFLLPWVPMPLLPRTLPPRTSPTSSASPPWRWRPIAKYVSLIIPATAPYPLRPQTPSQGLQTHTASLLGPLRPLRPCLVALLLRACRLTLTTDTYPLFAETRAAPESHFIAYGP